MVSKSEWELPKPIEDSEPSPVQWHFPLPVLCWLPVTAFNIKRVLMGNARAADLTEVPSASRAGGFSGEVSSQTTVSRNQNLSSLLGITVACSGSHWEPDVIQPFPLDFNQLFPNRFPRKPPALPTFPRWSVCHGICCCQWLSDPHSNSIQYPSGFQGSCTHSLPAQSRNSDVLSLYKQKSSVFLA